jgi:hypothetical protein
MSNESVIYVLGYKEIPNYLKIEYSDNFTERILYLNKEMLYEPIVYYKRYVPSAEFIETVIHHIFRKFQVENHLTWFKINDKNMVIDEINDVISFFEDKDEKYE